MPNLFNTINSVSPDFRDRLLNRNIITDTALNSGLFSHLSDIGKPVDISHVPESVIPSSDILISGIFYEQDQTQKNKYTGSEHERINIQDVNSTDIIPKFLKYDVNNTDNPNSIVYKDKNLPQGNPGFNIGGNIREWLSTKNQYVDIDKQEIINIVEKGANINVQSKSYLDENNNLNVGGPSTQIADVLGTLLTGQGLGIGQNGLITSFDTRASLAGRVLGATGIINDTKLGIIGGQQLAFSLSNNAGFNLQQETIGHINLNPLSILQGKSLIVPNYKITVPIGTLGKVLDFSARILGFESPVSLLSSESSIFDSDHPNLVIDETERNNNMIKNSGKGQMLSLFFNLNANSDPKFIGNRMGYVPAYNDPRISKGYNTGDGLNPNSYPTNNDDGDLGNLNEKYIIDNPDVNSRNNFRENGLTSFSWVNTDISNKEGLSSSFITENEFTNKKSILFKTQELFKNKKIMSIVSGHGIKATTDEIQTIVSRGGVDIGLMSKGSGVLSNDALNNNVTDPAKTFCRTWTTFDRYNQVFDLQKHSGLYRSNEIGGNSVLEDNGFVKISPYKTNEVKKYMFSIENLAWNENYSELPPCEQGPGDANGIKGRIMWFPPYDLNVSENNSMDWEANKFIGRGEPVYTYNNAERSGTLSFMVIVDHPNYINSPEYRTKSNEYMASFFAGCTEIDPAIINKLTTTEIQSISQKDLTQQPKKTPTAQKTPDNFSIYFSNDNIDVNETYENEKDSAGLGITYTSTPPAGRKYKEYNSVPGRAWGDETDFGLNNPGGKGFITTEFKTNLKNHLKNICPACRINIKGFASSQGNLEANKNLANDRAENVKIWFEQNILEPNDLNRFSKLESGGQLSNTGINGKPVDPKFIKEARKVDITFTYDITLDVENTDAPITEKEPVQNTTTITEKTMNKLINECDYFEKLGQSDPFIFDEIKKKIKYFHPAFHSTTPEGLNSRLNFLLQCTKQGPTHTNSSDKNKFRPDNLAFGRSPVCILRLGDFYHTKIVIDNIGISYEPLQWDLNPEGIGVQPMLAKVDLTFKFIGGQSLQGPINKLQNAVSFNFFANTHVYDPRADKLKKSGDNFEIVPGVAKNDNVKTITTESLKDGLGSSKTIISTNQIAENDKINNK